MCVANVNQGIDTLSSLSRSAGSRFVIIVACVLISPYRNIQSPAAQFSIVIPIENEAGHLSLLLMPLPEEIDASKKSFGVPLATRDHLSHFTRLKRKHMTDLKTPIFILGVRMCVASFMYRELISN